MPPRLTTESTTFARDVQGRYVCNTFDEAKTSADTAQFPDARPFDIIIRHTRPTSLRLRPGQGLGPPRRRAERFKKPAALGCDG